MFWCDRCGKRACPCSQSPKEQETLRERAEDRHAAAIDRAAETTAGPPQQIRLPAVSTGAYWKIPGKRIAHFFARDEKRSECGCVTRRRDAVQALRSDRLCQHCLRLRSQAGRKKGGAR